MTLIKIIQIKNLKKHKFQNKLILKLLALTGINQFTIKRLTPSLIGSLSKLKKIVKISILKKRLR